MSNNVQLSEEDNTINNFYDTVDSAQYFLISKIMKIGNIHICTANFNKIIAFEEPNEDKEMIIMFHDNERNIVCENVSSDEYNQFREEYEKWV